MGLVRRRASAPPFAYALLAACLLAASATSCIKELELPDSEAALLFVDGSVVVDSASQRLRIGRTDGVRASSVPAPGAEVEVVDETAGLRHAYRQGADGIYRASFTGQRGHAYHLEVTLGSGARYRSRADSLTTATLLIDGAADLSRDLGRDGELIDTRTVGTVLSIANADGVGGVLTIRPAVAWSFFDDVCDEFDESAQCWFEDINPTQAFDIIDLSLIEGGGAPVQAFVGPQAIDFRFSRVAFLISDIRRRSPAAGPYFTALAQALNPTGSPFDERPRPVAGNVETVGGPDGSATEAMLGFFGVTEAYPVYVPTAGNLDIRRIAPFNVCGLPADQRPPLDCCFCELSPGALTERPPYLP